MEKYINIIKIFVKMNEFRGMKTRMEPISREKELDLILNARGGDPIAKNEFVKQFDPVVKATIFKIGFDVGSIDDMVQDGRLGLVIALEKYDENKINEESGMPHRFSTYARWWVYAEIQAGFPGITRSGIPSWRMAVINKIERAQQSLFAENGEEPSLYEIRKKIIGKKNKKSVKQKYTITSIKAHIDLKNSARFYSLDQPAKGSTLLLNEVIGDPNVPYDNVGLDDYIERTLKSLSTIDSNVLTLRYLKGKRNMTLKEVGKHYGVTKERARQLEFKAIERFRRRPSDLQAYAP